MNEIKVLLADDHRVLRDGLKSMLDQPDEIEIVGEAQDGLQAVEMADRLSPDVIVMDIAMPNLNGIDATRSIRQKHPEIKIVVLTMYETEEYISEILKAGASCYITKDAAGDTLLEAIRMAQMGSVFLQPGSAISVVDQYYLNNGHKEKSDADLTGREVEILGLIVKGMSNKNLASQLGLSLHTIRAHRSNIMHKLDAHNAVELVNKASKLGLV